jgi:hypothetical protein
LDSLIPNKKIVKKSVQFDHEGMVSVMGIIVVTAVIIYFTSGTTKRRGAWCYSSPTPVPPDIGIPRDFLEPGRNMTIDK